MCEIERGIGGRSERKKKEEEQRFREKVRGRMEDGLEENDKEI